MSEDYTGSVTPGGDPAVRSLGCLSITKIAVDPEMANNCYLLTCATTGEQVLIDAAADAPRLLEAIGDRGLLTVVTTHQHWDHHRALAEVVAATGAAVVAGAPDADAITEQTGVEVTRRLQHGDRVAAGTCDLRVIALAGHTPGSIALLLDDEEQCGPAAHLFTGDSLFPGGVGDDLRGPRRLHPAARRGGDQGLRHAARRHLVLPRPRRRRAAGQRTPPPRGVARARLVAGRARATCP